VKQASNDQRLLVLEVVDHLLESWWTVIAGLCLGFAGAVLALQVMPRVYEATAELNLDAEKLASGTVREAVTMDPTLQLQALRRNVLSERYLDTISAEIYGPAANPAEREARIQTIRSGVSVRTNSWDQKFSLSYRDSDPERAARVVNALARIYVEENVRFRTDRAASAAETYQTRAEEVWDLLQEKRRQIDRYRADHPLRTEADRGVNVQGLQTAEAALQQNRETQAGLRAQLDQLEAEREQAEMMEAFSLEGAGAAPSSSAPAGTDPTLARLRSELRDLETRYADRHPLVTAKRAEIERHERTVRAAPTPEPVAPGPSRPASMTSHFDTQIRLTRAELESRQAEERKLLAEVGEFRRRLAATSEVQARIDEMSRDLNLLESEYKDFASQRLDAESAERVAATGPGKEFQIVGKASPPADPIFPKPLLIYGAGVALGLVVFVGPVLGRGLLMPVVRSEARLAEAIEVPVLVTIPRIETPAAVRQLRRNRMKNVVLAASSVAAVLAVVATRTWPWS